jgi:competence protein ComER
VNIGVIGTGNMGKILIEAFLKSSAVNEENLFIMNRTKSKAEQLKSEFPNIHVVDSPGDIVKSAEYIFLCIKPLDIYPLLKGLAPFLKKEQCIVSITSPISVEQLESIVPCAAVRVIPSINNRVLCGTSLLSFGEYCPEHHQAFIEELMTKISTPVTIEENITRVASDITSCGPAFFTFLLRKFIDAAVVETEITREQATLLASKMVIGLGQLIEQEVYTLETLQEKVVVKGGITGEGIKVLDDEIGAMFNHLFQQTHAKFNHEKEKVNEQFCIKD